MYEKNIDPKKIIDAGIVLQSEGRNITGFALRNKIGSGNPSELKTVWDEYQSSQSELNFNSIDELPVEINEELNLVSKGLIDKISQLAYDLNKKAVLAAERRVSEITRAAGVQTAKAERELSDATNIVEELEEKISESLSENIWLQQSLESERLLCRQRGAEISQLKDKLSNLEQSIKSKEEVSEKIIIDLQSSLKQSELLLQQEREANLINISDLRSRLKQSLDKERVLTSEIKRAHSEQVKLSSEIEKNSSGYEEQISKLNSELNKYVEKLARLEKSRNEARTELSDVREQLATIQNLQGHVEDSNATSTSFVQKHVAWNPKSH